MRITDDVMMVMSVVIKKSGEDRHLNEKGLQKTRMRIN
jgi:hypothetical protein